MILHHFCWRSSKIKLFSLKTRIFNQKSRKYPKNPENSRKFLGTYVETYVQTYKKQKYRFSCAASLGTACPGDGLFEKNSDDHFLSTPNRVDFQRKITNTGLHRATGVPRKPLETLDFLVFFWIFRVFSGFLVKY